MCATSSPAASRRSTRAFLERPSMRSHRRDLSRSKRPVMKLLRRLRKVVSSTPRRRGGAWGRPARRRRAAAAIARHAVDQPTRNVRATAAVDRSRAARAIAAHNRAVNRRRGGTSRADSVNEPTHPGVSQPMPPLGPHQHRRALKAQPVAHPLSAILLDPTAEDPTTRARRITAPDAHRHLQPAGGGLDRAGHLEVLQTRQHARNITHLGASFSGQRLLPDSRGPDPRTRTLTSQGLPHQPRRATNETCHRETHSLGANRRGATVCRCQVRSRTVSSAVSTAHCSGAVR